MQRAVQRAADHLLARQHPDGWWKGDLETNVTMDAEDLLLRQFLGIRDERVTAASAPGDHSAETRGVPGRSPTPALAVRSPSYESVRARWRVQGSWKTLTQWVRPARRVCSPQRAVTKRSNGVGRTGRSSTRRLHRAHAPRWGARRRTAPAHRPGPSCRRPMSDHM